MDGWFTIGFTLPLAECVPAAAGSHVLDFRRIRPIFGFKHHKCVRAGGVERGSAPNQPAAHHPGAPAGIYQDERQ
jgi:hypothetical protein